MIDALTAATQGRTVIIATHSTALARSADAELAIADAAVRPVREGILR